MYNIKKKTVINIWVSRNTESFFSGIETQEQLPSTELVRKLQRLSQILRKVVNSYSSVQQTYYFKSLFWISVTN